MNTSDIVTICDYNRWANERVLRMAAALTTAQFSEELHGSNHSVRETLYHICGAEWLWLMRWKGISPKSMPDPAEFNDLDAIRNKWSSIEMDQYNFLSKISDETLREVVEYESTEGDKYELPLWVMIHHLVNHSTHHRGQLLLMLRQLGAEVETLDFTAFLRSRAA